MRKISAVLVILTGICFACEKKEDPKYSGEIILSSELMLSDQLHSYYGFNFEDGTDIHLFAAQQYSTRSVAIHIIFQQNVGVTLQSSNQDDAFHKNGDFATAADAETFFNSYSEVTAQGFQGLADNVEVNQVWTIKTAANKYAKIWIKDIQLKTGGALSDYVELTIRYQYQPDGTKTFP